MGTLYGHTSSTIVLLNSSVSRSGAFGGGCVSVTLVAKLQVNNSDFEGCYAAVNGGAAFIGEYSTASFTNSKIKDSHSDGRGGGIGGFVLSSVTVEKSVVENCSATHGGGAQSFLLDTHVSSNSAYVGCVAKTAAGGGVNVLSSQLAVGGGTFINVLFKECHSPAGVGGGLAVDEATRVSVSNSRFLRCGAGKGGGMASIAAGVSLDVSKTAIENCISASDGGALYLSQDGRACIQGGALSGNVAGGDGGGIATSAASRLFIFKTHIEKNVGTNGGGFAVLSAATIGVSHSIIKENVAFIGGGASVTDGSTLHLGPSTLFTSNSASIGGALDLRGKGGVLFASASCAFVQITLDWTPARVVDASEASVSLAGTGGEDARSEPDRFDAQGGALADFEACLSPGKYALWAASAKGRPWLEAAWALKLPPVQQSVLSFVEERVTFLQAVNEKGAQGLSEEQTHGDIGAAFALEHEDTLYLQPATHVQIVGNSATSDDGGGLSLAEEARCVLFETSFENNSAAAGGGAVSVGAQSSAKLRSVKFVGNAAGKDGGAVRVGMLGMIHVENCTAFDNATKGRGGFAVLDRVRTASLESVSANGNAADRGGAVALALCDQEEVIIKGSTFHRNSAIKGGGAFDVEDSLVSVERVLFTENSVESGGGGGVAVRPSGETLKFAPQAQGCVATLRVVLDWRFNLRRCEIVGEIAGTGNIVEETCDGLKASCGPMRTLAGEERCLGCTCQENVLGQGESFFEVFSDNIRLFVDEPDAGASKVFEYCLADGDYAILASDRRGSKWFGGAMIVSVKTFLGVELIKQSAVWGTNGSQTNPIHFTVPAFAQESLAVRFFGNEALGGGGAAIFWVDRAPAGLETAATHSSNNKASYGDFAATPATRLVVNTTDLTAVPNATMPSIAAVLLDDYGRTVSSDSSTPVGVVFQDGVQASGLVSICSFGRADFDAITITGKPGDEHALTFYSPTNGLAAGPLKVELASCPVGFVERADGEFSVSCIPCKYTEYYIQGACIPCPRGAGCDRYPPLDALSQSVGYQLFTVATLPVKVGFYRFYATSAVFYPCADAEYCDTTNCACAGASYDVAFRDPRKTHGQRLCRGSSVGPLCALCAAGHYAKPASLDQGGGCAACDKDSALPIFFAIVFAALVAGLVVVSGAAIFCAGTTKTKSRVFKATSFARSRWGVVAAVQVWYAVSRTLSPVRSKPGP